MLSRFWSPYEAPWYPWPMTLLPPSEPIGFLVDYILYIGHHHFNRPII